ncbi:MAG: GAF domain-containing protein [Candidatus Riflebacteria bacterium]|nr:GAF domain-containing protein [Candidatus Riflebacteria bacterium]
MVKKVQIYWPYLEATVFVALVALINDWFFPDNTAFRGLPFSLLWFPILLIAGRYGTAPAVFTSLICSGFYFFQVSLENFFLGTFELTSEDKVTIFAFLFVGIFLGQMYDRLMNKLISLQHEHEDLKGQNDNLLLHFQVLENANQELEKRVVGRYSTLTSLYEMAQGLESLDEKNLFRGVLELVQRFIHAESMSLFLLDDHGQLILQETMGILADEKSNLEMSMSTHQMVRQVIEKNETLTFRDGFEEQAKAPEMKRVLMAAPIYLPGKNTRFGVICLHKIPFLALNASNQRILGMISDWTARAVEKSKLFRDLQARELDDRLTGVYSYSYFQLRFDEEMNRAQRHRLPLTLVLIRIIDFEKMTGNVQEDILAILGLVFNNSIRTVDIPCRYKDPSRLAIILPLTDAAGASKLGAKLRRDIESYGFKPFHDDQELKVGLNMKTFMPINDSRHLYGLDKTFIEEFLIQSEAGLIEISSQSVQTQATNLDLPSGVSENIGGTVLPSAGGI